MPSELALPTIQEHIETAGRAVVGRKDLLADVRRGAIYEFLFGTSALAWAREAQADRDKFRAVNFNAALGDDLTSYVKLRFGIDRVLDSFGAGTCSFARASTAAGAGTVFAGTRVSVPTVNGAIVYQVAADTAFGATQTAGTVPIASTAFGDGSKISNANAVVVDPLWDSSFVVSGLSCADGTTFESAPAFRARVVSTLLQQRPGYPTLIATTLNALGAPNVVLFPSQYNGTDSGISVAYVGDSSHNCSDALLAGARAGLEAARVLGADLQVSRMSAQSISIALTVALWRDPSFFDQNKILAKIAAGVVQYFQGGQNAIAYKVDGIQGAAERVTPDVQGVTVTAINGGAPVDATFSPNPWPATLFWNVASTNSVSVTLTGPS